MRIDADGVDHRAGENVNADFRHLFEHDDRQIRIDLLQGDRRRKPAGPEPTITTSNSMLSRAGTSM